MRKTAFTGGHPSGYCRHCAENGDGGSHPGGEEVEATVDEGEEVEMQARANRKRKGLFFHLGKLIGMKETGGRSEAQKQKKKARGGGG